MKDYIELEQHQLWMSQSLPIGLQGVKYWKEDIYNGVRVSMTAYVMAEKVAEETVYMDVRYPIDWWNHWKRDKAPTWLVRRWPVKYKMERKMVVSHWAGYPELPLSIPDTKHVFRFVKWPVVDEPDL